jgi:hypothetical protein
MTKQETIYIYEVGCVFCTPNVQHVKVELYKLEGYCTRCYKTYFEIKPYGCMYELNIHVFTSILIKIGQGNQYKSIKS